MKSYITLEHPGLGPDQRITVTEAAYEVGGGLKDSGWVPIAEVKDRSESGKRREPTSDESEAE